MCFKLMHLHSSAQGFLNHSSIRVVDISLCIDLLHVYPQTEYIELVKAYKLFMRLHQV